MLRPIITMRESRHQSTVHVHYFAADKSVTASEEGVSQLPVPCNQEGVVITGPSTTNSAPLCTMRTEEQTWVDHSIARALNYDDETTPRDPDFEHVWLNIHPINLQAGNL